MDAELLARAIHDTGVEYLAARERESRAAGILVGGDRFEPKAFDEVPESSRADLIERAGLAAKRYMELLEPVAVEARVAVDGEWFRDGTVTITDDKGNLLAVSPPGTVAVTLVRPNPCPECEGYGWVIDKPWKPGRNWMVCGTCRNEAGAEMPPDDEDTLDDGRRREARWGGHK